MSNNVITVENLSKKYLLGRQQQGRSNYKALRDVITESANSCWRNILNPTRVIKQKHVQEEFWALKNIDLNIEQGSVVGIVGRNGAGKSTLLKVLSRITEPTLGRIKLKGRVASLLEVGTGFHPELTGRENIFLNGAILGMNRNEISKNFSEIVEFAEVEKFLDTPVKRYSSGMYVRLAFAIAAHLTSEILIIDEVLAVGDAAFQSKCLGKMESISSKEGRTVLFVSHNMGMVQKLCNQGIFLNQGTAEKFDSCQEAINCYLNSIEKNVDSTSLYDIPREKGLGEKVRINHCNIYNSKNLKTTSLYFGEPFSISLEGISNASIDDLSVLIRIDSFAKDAIVTTASESSDIFFSVNSDKRIRACAKFKNLLLRPGIYWITLSLRQGKNGIDQIKQATEFKVHDAHYSSVNPFPGTWGHIQYIPEWT